MICELVQQKTNFNMSWIVSDNNGIICNVESPFETSCFNAYFDFLTNTKYRMYYNPTDKTYGKRLEDRFGFHIFDTNDNHIGKFAGKNRKTGKFFGGYVYYELLLGNTQFEGYEVGRGKEGIALCLYAGNELLAIIDKNTTTVNFHDNYKMYLLSPQYLHIATMFAVYYDMLKFANIGEVMLYSKTETYLITVNNELKSKYNPEFISRIKAMDGIVDEL